MGEKAVDDWRRCQADEFVELSNDTLTLEIRQIQFSSKYSDIIPSIS